MKHLHFLAVFMKKQNMNKIKFCITGGSGFIGTAAMNWALSKYETINFDIRPPKILEHQDHWRFVDIRDVESLT